MEAYNASEQTATGSVPERDEALKARRAEQARSRRARKRERKEAYRLLDSMKVLELENAVKRAPHKAQDRAGRTLRLKENVAAMCRQLIFWEGKGEADGDWIWKTAEEWHQEAGLTYRMLRVARDVAKAEGLLDYEERGTVGESRIYYRLNMTAVLRVVATSELEVAKEWLDRHPRSKKRPEWEKKRKKWEGIVKDLEAWGVEGIQKPDNPQPLLRSGQSVTSEKPIDKGNPLASEGKSGSDLQTPLTSCKGSPDNLSVHQESTRRFRLPDDSSGGGRSVASVDAPAASQDRSSELNELMGGVASKWRMEDAKSNNVMTDVGDDRERSGTEQNASCPSPDSDHDAESRAWRLPLPVGVMVKVAGLKFPPFGENEVSRLVT